MSAGITALEAAITFAVIVFAIVLAPSDSSFYQKTNNFIGPQSHSLKALPGVWNLLIDGDNLMCLFSWLNIYDITGTCNIINMKN